MGDKARGAADGGRRPACRCCPAAGRPLASTRRGERGWRREVGYPVILKAAAGGGGRGMRIVRAEKRARERVRDRRVTRREKAFGDGSIYLEKYLERAAPHRVPGLRRPPRQRHPPRRARVLDPAPPPEADRGVAVARADARAARRAWARPRSRLCQAVGYENAGTIEFLLDQRRQLLLHGDEHPHPGRAPGHRDGHRRRPGQAADPRSPPASALTVPNGAQAARPRDRMPDQRRGSGHLRAVARQADDVPPARRARRARRHARLRGLRHPALLRLAGRQADRPRGQPRRGDRAHGAGARFLRRRGHQDVDSRCTGASCRTRVPRRASSRRASWSGSCSRAPRSQPPADGAAHEGLPHRFHGRGEDDRRQGSGGPPRLAVRRSRRRSRGGGGRRACARSSPRRARPSSGASSATPCCARCSAIRWSSRPAAALLPRRKILEAMRQGGLTVWLNPPFSTIAARVGSLGKEDRPLFRDETQACDALPRAAAGLPPRRPDDRRRPARGTGGDRCAHRAAAPERSCVYLILSDMHGNSDALRRRAAASATQALRRHRSCWATWSATAPGRTRWSTRCASCRAACMRSAATTTRWWRVSRTARTSTTPRCRPRAGRPST